MRQDPRHPPAATLTHQSAALPLARRPLLGGWHCAEARLKPAYTLGACAGAWPHYRSPGGCPEDLGRRSIDPIQGLLTRGMLVVRHCQPFTRGHPWQAPQRAQAHRSMVGRTRSPPRKEQAMAIRPPFVGARMKRREDPALIQGLGQYVDDIPLAGTLHAAFVRSPYAHARITGLHVEAARQHPGVVAVLTGQDILGKVGTIPCVAAAPGLKL